MNSRERVLAAVEHKQPDRVPIDLGATPSSGISAIAYGRLKQRLGLRGGHNRIYDVVQQVAQPEDEILDRFRIDVVDVGRAFNTAEDDWYDIKLFDGSAAQYPRWFRPRPRPDGGWGVDAPDGTEIAIQLKGMNFFDQTCFPWVDGYPDDFRELRRDMAKVHWAALAPSPWDNAARPDFWEKLRLNALALRRQTDRAIIVGCSSNLFEWGAFLRRMDNFLMDLAAQPAAVERFLDALMDVHLDTLIKVCGAVGDIADIIRFGDDLGMETGPLMSRETYRRFFKPRQARLFDVVKKRSGMKTFLHSCGSIAQYLPDLIDAGLEIINPVQTSSYGMAPERLKAEFGRDITFWGGGCDTRTILNRAAPRDVKDHVKRRLEIFSKGGGFVFCAVHNILPDVPPENILAMFEAVEEFNG